jgi:ERCC4-type nuclease
VLMVVVVVCVILLVNLKVWREKNGGREFVLPVLVERKRADDLAISMVDGL